MKPAYQSLIVCALMSMATISLQAEDAIKTGHFMVQAANSELKIYVRNKCLAGKTSFAADRTVLFVHGATYPAEVFFDIDLPGGSWMEHAAVQGFDAYLVDVRGYGRSERPATMDQPPSANPPLATTADAVVDVGAAVDFILQHRGIAKLNLVGASWGTVITATFTTLNNAKVNKLVLYAPLWLAREPLSVPTAGHYRTVQKHEARQRGLRGIPAARIEEISPTPWFEQWWSEVLRSDPDGARRNPPVLRAPDGVVKDRAAIWAQGRSTYDPAAIRVPTMIAIGEWDQDTPPYMAHALHAKLTGAPRKRLVTIPEATHSMALEKNRRQVIQQVQSFLEE